MAKILIVRLGAMGDILHALPAATSIRAALPDATIGWLVESKWKELLAAKGQERGPVVNVIHAVDTQRWRKLIFSTETHTEISSSFKAIRALHYDVIFHHLITHTAIVTVASDWRRDLSGQIPVILATMRDTNTDLDIDYSEGREAG